MLTVCPARGDLYDYVRGLQASVIVNNRVGHGIGDFGTPEQEIPATGIPARTGKHV
jgi:alpha-L-fucosidase